VSPLLPSTLRILVLVEAANNDDSNKEGKAYVIFGKQDGTAINLSAIASGIGGFLINSETMSDDRGNKAAMHIFHANTLLNPKCSFGISVGITMSINIISNTILS
jgi:hypothetical protein